MNVFEIDVQLNENDAFSQFIQSCILDTTCPELDTLESNSFTELNTNDDLKGNFLESNTLIGTSVKLDTSELAEDQVIGLCVLRIRGPFGIPLQISKNNARETVFICDSINSLGPLNQMISKTFLNLPQNLIVSCDFNAETTDEIPLRKGYCLN